MKLSMTVDSVEFQIESKERYLYSFFVSRSMLLTNWLENVTSLYYKGSVISITLTRFTRSL